MPNRIIKESVCTSDNIDQLTDFQENFFYRLIVNCDDFGRFDARPKLLSSRLYPLKSIPTDAVEDALDALQKADLITLYSVDGHPYLFVNKWDQHQQKRSDKSKFPEPTESNLIHIVADDEDCEQMKSDDEDCNQMKSSDINCNQVISDDSKFPRIRNRNRNTYNDIRDTNTNTNTELSDVDAQKTLREQNQVLEAAENAGFKMSPWERSSLVDLYAQHGLEKVLNGIEACVKHGVSTLAYLEGCLNGKPKKQKPVVPVQDYEQRDYSDAENEVRKNMLAMMNETG